MSREAAKQGEPALYWEETKMELNITRFFREAAPMDYSASIAEIGNDAARSTWEAAVDDSDDYPMLDSDEKREEFRRYVKGFGAWTEDEIRAWSDQELNALLIQMIAGDIREAKLDTDNPDWEQYEKDSEAGRVAGRIFKGSDSEIYYYIGEYLSIIWTKAREIWKTKCG